MKNIVALIMLGSISLTAFTQESKSKFSIGAIFSHNMAYRTLTPEKNYPYPGVVDVINEYEVPKFGYSVGFTVFYAIHKKIKLQSGITFTDNGYRTKKQEPLYFGNQFNGTGFDPSLASGENITAVGFSENFYYIDIPLQVKYSFFQKKKIGFYVTGGVEANFNVASQHVVIKWDENGQKEREKFDYPFSHVDTRKFNFSTVAGVGMDIHISSKVALFVQPTFRYMVLSVVKDVPLKKRLYSTGLAMGVNIGL